MIEFVVNLISKYWMIFAGLCVIGILALIIFWKTWVSLFLKYKEICMYVVFGGMTTIVNLIVYDLFTELVNAPIWLATLLSWIISVLFAFVTNKLFVYESKDNSFDTWIKEGIRFFSARLVSLGLEEIIMYVACTLMNFDDKIVKIVAQATLANVNYLLGKLMVFKEK